MYIIATIPIIETIPVTDKDTILYNELKCKFSSKNNQFAHETPSENAERMSILIKGSKL